MSRFASARRKRSYVSGSVLVVLAMMSGCAGAPTVRSKNTIVPTIVSAATMLAEPIGDPEQELETLQRATSPAATLRAGFLYLRLGRTQAALDAGAEVLFGSNRPTANEESFARYLRAEAQAAKGTPELGAFDRQRARQLALDPELQRRLALTDRTASPAGEAPALALAIQSRQQWHAAAPDRGNIEPMGKPNRLTIHHSAMYFRDTRPASCIAQLQTIQRDHMRTRGYADIGYHFLIDPSGRIWQGRDLRYQGAHASGDNNLHNIGICLLGNFMHGRTGQGPTGPQTASMRQLVTSLMQRYDFGADAIHCHSDFKATECPGPLLEPVVAQLARELRKSKPGRVAIVSP